MYEREKTQLVLQELGYADKSEAKRKGCWVSVVNARTLSSEGRWAVRKMPAANATLSF